MTNCCISFANTFFSLSHIHSNIFSQINNYLGKGKRTIGNVTLNGVYLSSTPRLSVLITAVLLQLLQEAEVVEPVRDDTGMSLLILLDFTDDNNDPDAERLELRTLDAKYNCLGDEFFDTNTVS